MVPRNGSKTKKREKENSKETRAHLEAMVLRTKPEANQWLHWTPRIAALGTDAFERGPVMIKKIHAYLVKEVSLAENAEEKSDVGEQSMPSDPGNILDTKFEGRRRL